MSRMLAALMAAALVLLGFVIWNEQTASVPDGESAAAAATRPLPVLSGRPQTENAEQRAQWVQTILARPLFSPGRRPAAQAVAAAAPGRGAGAAAHDRHHD